MARLGTNEMLRLLFQIGLSASLLAGCAGGQTGEITELGACRVAIGEVAIDAASEAGSLDFKALDKMLSVEAGASPRAIPEASSAAQSQAPGKPTHPGQTLFRGGFSGRHRIPAG